MSVGQSSDMGIIVSCIGKSVGCISRTSLQESIWIIVHFKKVTGFRHLARSVHVGTLNRMMPIHKGRGGEEFYPINSPKNAQGQVTFTFSTFTCKYI